MSPLLLRKLWSLVEMTQTNVLLGWDDDRLVQWLLKQLTTERSLDSNEADFLNDYLHSRLPLIRDMAHSRLAI